MGLGGAGFAAPHVGPASPRAAEPKTAPLAAVAARGTLARNAAASPLTITASIRSRGAPPTRRASTPSPASLRRTRTRARRWRAAVRDRLDFRRAAHRAVIARIAAEGDLASGWTVDIAVDLFYAITMPTPRRELTGQGPGWESRSAGDRAASAAAAPVRQLRSPGREGVGGADPQGPVQLAQAQAARPGQRAARGEVGQPVVKPETRRAWWHQPKPSECL